MANHEIRFPVTKEVKDRHEELTLALGRRSQELARAVYFLGLEKLELELSRNKFPMFVPIPNKKIVEIKFDKEDLNNS